MKDLHLPHSYASIPENEQRLVTGGGPLGDALDLFFGSARLDDFFFGGGLISFSFSFVPLLLFNVVKTALDVGIDLYNNFSGMFHFSDEGDQMMKYLASRQSEEQRRAQEKMNPQPQANSFR